MLNSIKVRIYRGKIIFGEFKIFNCSREKTSLNEKS